MAGDAGRGAAGAARADVRPVRAESDRLATRPGAAGRDERLPFLANRPARDGQATAYVCEHFACLPPVHDPEALLRQLEQGTGVSWREF